MFTFKNNILYLNQTQQNFKQHIYILYNKIKLQTINENKHYNELNTKIKNLEDYNNKLILKINILHSLIEQILSIE